MTPPLRLGHVPCVDAAAVEWHALHFEAHGRRLALEVPRLAAPQLRAVAAGVRQAAAHRLAPLPVTAIVAVVDRAAARLLDTADPLRRIADEWLPVVTGFDPEMVALGLTASLQTFRAAALRRFVAQDFANPLVLDGFQPAVKGGSVRAFGPGLLAHVWAGNVPALPLWSLVCGLLVKGGNVGRLPSAEPLLATLFVRALCEVEPAWSDALALVWWDGSGDQAPARALFGAADAVLAYGGDATLAALRRQVPDGVRWLPHGHRIGVALVGRAALDPHRGPAAARRLAHDVVRWEQQGCYSPHAVYVERGGALSPRGFAQHLAAELAALGQRHPRRRLSLPETAAVAAWRRGVEWRALADPAAAALLGSDDAPWAVAFDDPAQPLAPTAGQRCIAVGALATLDDALPLLAPHALHLQTVGLATTPDELYRLGAALGRVGVTRIAPLGAMAQPEAGWHHDGRFSLADLVRTVEIDGAAERAADALAPYAQEDAA